MTNSFLILPIKQQWHSRAPNMLRDCEHPPTTTTTLMSVHFEAKTNLYFVLFCLQDGYYFCRDGKWS